MLLPDEEQTWLVGSRLYGIHNEDSDYDYRSVVFRRDDFVDPFRSKEWATDGEEKSSWSLAKFARLLVVGNPNVLDLVYNPPLEETPFIAGLVSSARPFAITNKTIDSYIGYLRSQQSRAFRSQRGTRGNPTYDMKYLSHAFRLHFSLVGILATGGYHYLSEDERSFIRHVRAGGLPGEEVVGILNERVSALDKVRNTLPGPETLTRVVRLYIRNAL